MPLRVHGIHKAFNSSLSLKAFLRFLKHTTLFSYLISLLYEIAVSSQQIQLKTSCLSVLFPDDG